jgi:signal peptidase II
VRQSATSARPRLANPIAVVEATQVQRKLATLFAIALAVVVVDQGVKYWMVDELTTRFDNPPTLGARLGALYGTPPPEAFDGLHFRPKRSVTLSPDYLRIRYAENTGAAFGLFRGVPSVVRGLLFHLVSLGAVVLITAYYVRLSSLAPQERFARLGLPLVLGGALGNYVDRLARGFVIDFVEAHWHDRATWPSFNVADSCIVVGVGLLLLDGLTRRERKAEPAAAAEQAGKGSP